MYFLRQTALYECARQRLSELKNTIPLLEARLSKAPPGKIHVIRKQKHDQYYLRTSAEEQTGTYISKKETAKIKVYLQKAYDEKTYKIVKHEIKSIEAFLKHSEDYNLKIQQLYSKCSVEEQSYIIPIDFSDDDYALFWQKIPFIGNSMPFPETEYITDLGERVRSKSEMNIANALAKARIPYKYECPVKLKKGSIAYPDFTILDIKRRKILYWEHRGMMDDRDYVITSVRKIKEYSKSGIITGINLFITEENGTAPLGTDEINAIINGILHN